jgi:hypothetical protein
VEELEREQQLFKAPSQVAPQFRNLQACSYSERVWLVQRALSDVVGEVNKSLSQLVAIANGVRGATRRPARTDTRISGLRARSNRLIAAMITRVRFQPREKESYPIHALIPFFSAVGSSLM